MPNDGYHLNDTVCETIINVIGGISDADLDAFWLGQNIPNPSNGITMISYSIPNSGNVSFSLVSHQMLTQCLKYE